MRTPLPRFDATLIHTMNVFGVAVRALSNAMKSSVPSKTILDSAGTLEYWPTPQVAHAVVESPSVSALPVKHF
jgi:hypothetical protein